MKRYLLVSSLAIGLVFSCKTEKKEEVAEVVKIPGIILENMDTSVDPKQDFYQYVNGSWLKNNEIPAEEASWGGFNVLRKSTRLDVLDIVNDAMASGKYGPGTDQAKAIAIYQSELDSTRRNADGVKSLQPMLDAIDNSKNMADLQTIYAKQVGLSMPFFSFASFPDLNDSKTNGAYIFPGGLGLPERDYYTDEGEQADKRREQYVAHVARMLQFIGYDEAQASASAQKILELETQLAKPRLTKEQQRDIRNLNNPRTIAELQKMTPSVDWAKFLKDLNVRDDLSSLIVGHADYMGELEKFLKKTPMEDLKLLAKWATLNDAARYLSQDIDRANWEFYAKTLRGTQAMRPAAERALSTVNNSVGEAIGKLYVDSKFPPEAKAKAEEMIANVITAFKKRIDVLEWMGDSTKIKAKEKLNKFTVKIGYPDDWEDYSAMGVNADKSFAENMLAVGDWQVKKMISEVGEPVDKSEWGMSPQEVNAYHHPLNNEIVFPAAILQPPFYNYTADDAVNYGGIGAVIGHEISHAFDDSGARFDSNGNVNNWWTADDLEEFEKRGNLLAEQYNALEVAPDLFVNGKFTLGENIGDLGGVLGAYDALQMHFEKHGKPDNIDGFTPEQRFFMSWATVWRTLTRPDALETQIKTDPHSPGFIRAIQPLKNVDAFYEAFDIKEGDGMWVKPEDRVRIW